MSRWAATACLVIGLSGAMPAIWPATAADSMKFASPSAAFEAATSAMQAGRADEAVRALEYAADKGMLGAIRKLARIYATGEGVPQSDASAFGYYQRIGDEFANISPRHPLAGHVAEAFVALASYYRNGLAELGLKPDTVHAARLYRHAASYFGDPSAQFALARMYLAGEGVNANVRLAVNWLANAAKKQHAPSQALLGDLLWQGKDDSYHQPLKGLALLTLARDNAAGTADAGWVEKLYARATGEAAPEQREQAQGLAARWRRTGRGRNPGVARDSQASQEVGQKALSARPKAPLAVTSADPVQSAPLAIRNAGTTESVQAR